MQTKHRDGHCRTTWSFRTLKKIRKEQRPPQERGDCEDFPDVKNMTFKRGLTF